MNVRIYHTINKACGAVTRNSTHEKNQARKLGRQEEFETSLGLQETISKNITTLGHWATTNNGFPMEGHTEEMLAGQRPGR